MPMCRPAWTCIGATAPGAIFATLAEEKKTNPFLRVDSAEAFAELRRRKDCF